MSTDFLTHSSFLELEQKAFEATQRIFPCEEEMVNHIPLENIWNTFKNDLVPQSTPFLIRVAGQSGSGKSSQLVPALEYALRKTKYFKISVGLFASFHPSYDQWQKTCPHEMREKTNGFALRALVLFYKQCILHKVNIILDMTLLEPEIDIYLMTLAKQMGYRIQMHILCVPHKVSELFIHLRQLKTGRQVKSSSSRYFFDALPRCLRALTHSNLFNKTDLLILWSHYLTRPIRKTHLHNPTVLRILGQYRQAPLCLKEPKILLKNKKMWINQLMESWYV